MNGLPIPLFDTYESFVDQNFSVYEPENSCIAEYLRTFPDELCAVQGYLAVRSFLRAYSYVPTTFASYRTAVERLLLWTLIVKKKPLFALKRQDAQDYLDFCRNPLPDWIGPVTRSRFISKSEMSSGTEFSMLPNPNWRPFNVKASKSDIRSDCVDQPETVQRYSPSKGTMAQVFSICSRFYEFLIEDGAAQANPFRMIKKAGRSNDVPEDISATRALTPLQWDYVLENAEQMAQEEPHRHERTLFILATLFSMYLRVSDLVGRRNWKPTMGDFRQDPEGNWWFFAVGKGNKSGKIAVRDAYITRYLTRYRRFLGLSDLPSAGESTPLIKTLSGRSGLSDRQVRALLQAVFDRTLNQMRLEGRAAHEMEALKFASAHWLRHTSATFDAPLRNAKDLQTDLRHSNLSTTQNTYYHSHDQERALSIKKLEMRDRG
ncbi:integrase [Pseudomonas sp. PA1(2017)]|uniref:tyrosine-type recombinase/integrase n=1 Tax=Pseudomonas sp. PA1(2017) TaxID=1932113 RepID=UPI0009604F68|nr:integrase [Pseudomonas sp. PA1(2017)]OLU17773.1 integrase [Pseudomonas sp. PA1(2017)]